MRRSTAIGLLAILIVGLALRLAVVVTTAPDADLGLRDPDGYSGSATTMVVDGHWRWNPAVVDYIRFTKPPLYPVVLSIILWADRGAYPGSAMLVHALANASLIVVIFWIGRLVHGDAAGLVAAGLFAIYWPAVTSSWFFLQENLYIPVVVAALGMMLHAIAREAPRRAWLVTGAVFGLAALIRSMPVYFLPPALLLHVVMAANRRVALRQAGALLAGFALLVVPYSAYISIAKHQLILIENMATIRARITYPGEGEPAHFAPPPSLVEAATMFARGFIQDPLGFAEARFDNIGAMFKPRGGRWLQEHRPVATAADALRLRMLTYLANDLPYLLAVFLAPLGWALARRRREASMLALWVVVNVALVTAAAMGGARYRAPLEPAMMVLAAVVMTGGFRRPRRLEMVAALLATGIVTGVQGRTLILNFEDRADYGLVERPAEPGWHPVAHGEAGFNVLSSAPGIIEFFVRARPDGDASPMRLDISIEGQPVNQVKLLPDEPAPFRFGVDAPQRLYYVEVKAQPRADGARPRLEIALAPPASSPPPPATSGGPAGGVPFP